MTLAVNPLPDDKILDRSNLKQSAEDNFKFDENSRKFSKQVENTVGKGEIARYEQFLLFPQCFQRACLTGASKGVIVWEWVKVALNPNTTNNDNFEFDENGGKFSEWVKNTVGKGEIACHKKLRFPGVFKKPVQQRHKNKGLFGKGLRVYLLKPPLYCK